MFVVSLTLPNAPSPTRIMPLIVVRGTAGSARRQLNVETKARFLSGDLHLVDEFLNLSNDIVV